MARSYLKAAETVNNAHGGAPGLERYFPPTYVLFGHAIELILKAYLASHGLAEGI
jgi:hypothetical protein